MGIRVAQPSSGEELENILLEVAPFDVGVVVAFGMILGPTALETPRRGFVNVHFSLLPRWRGAAPVERAILAGDETIGVTLMMMDAGLDTGPIVASESTPIRPAETAGELTERLAELGAGLLSRHLVDFVAGEMRPVPQPAEGATYADRIKPDEAVISATSTSTEMLRAVRAYAPRPGARFKDGTLKVWKAAPTELGAIPPGRLEFDGQHLYLGTGDYPVELIEVQAPGGRRMSGSDWARGRRGDLGRLV